MGRERSMKSGIGAYAVQLGELKVGAVVTPVSYTHLIHHAKRMLYGFVRIWSIHHNIMH